MRHSAHPIGTQAVCFEMRGESITVLARGMSASCIEMRM